MRKKVQPNSKSADNGGLNATNKDGARNAGTVTNTAAEGRTSSEEEDDLEVRPLTVREKRYLLAVERGNLGKVKE
jgi:hypothetical protein